MVSCYRKVKDRFRFDYMMEYIPIPKRLIYPEDIDKKSIIVERNCMKMITILSYLYMNRTRRGYSFFSIDDIRLYLGLGIMNNVSKSSSFKGITDALKYLKLEKFIYFDCDIDEVLASEQHKLFKCDLLFDTDDKEKLLDINKDHIKVPIYYIDKIIRYVFDPTGYKKVDKSRLTYYFCFRYGKGDYNFETPIGTINKLKKEVNMRDRTIREYDEWLKKIFKEDEEHMKQLNDFVREEYFKDELEGD